MQLKVKNFREIIVKLEMHRKHKFSKIETLECNYLKY